MAKKNKVTIRIKNSLGEVVAKATHRLKGWNNGWLNRLGPRTQLGPGEKRIIHVYKNEG